jgi:hypothetical protein
MGHLTFKSRRLTLEYQLAQSYSSIREGERIARDIKIISLGNKNFADFTSPVHTPYHPPHYFVHRFVSAISCGFFIISFNVTTAETKHTLRATTVCRKLFH